MGFAVYLRCLITLLCISSIRGYPVVRTSAEATWLKGFVATICKTAPALVAHCNPTDKSTVKGMLQFEPLWQDSKCHVKLTGEFEGLTPSSKHGIHIHMYGDIGANEKGENDGTLTGGHYDMFPDRKHALPGEVDEHHAGDIGNLVADANGRATYELTVDSLDLAKIRGRGVVIHAEEDMGVAEQPTGGAGARLATGVIGYRYVRPDEASG